MNPREYRSPQSDSNRAIAPRYGCKRTFPRQYRFLAGVLIAVALLLAIMGTPPVSAVTLDHHILGLASDSDRGIEPTFAFTTDDTVISEVHLKDATEGDLIEWVYTGPQGTLWNKSQTFNPGQSATVRATLDLDLLPLRERVGSWTVDLSLNGEPQDRLTFTVEPLTGLTWWGPFLGSLLAILGVLGVVIVLVLLMMGKKKKAQ